MNHYTLTSNKLLRNILVTIDVCCVCCVLMTFSWLELYPIHRPFVMMVLAIISMFMAQLRFHSILHDHYSKGDVLFSRATGLCFTFGLLLGLTAACISWGQGRQVCDVHAVLYVTLATYALILMVRFAEFFLLKFLRRKGLNSRVLFFVGNTEEIQGIKKDLDMYTVTGLRYAGYYAPEEDETLSGEMKYLGNYVALEELAASSRRFADEVYCALPMEESELHQKLIHYCMRNVVHYYFVPSFTRHFGRYLKPVAVANQIVFANFNEPLLNPLDRFIKRVFDILLSSVAILILLPFVPIILLCIVVQSPGNPFFGQYRTGINGKDFRMWKFRSMHINAQCDQLQATKDDPRKFPFGNFMRKTSIDELPQLWNILMGDMSLVGPRPHMRSHTDAYSQTIDYYMVRHYVRPGLTGWAQTTGFRGETQELWQMEERVKRDIWYIQNWSFWLDLRIICKTFLQIISKDKQAY